MAEGDDRAPLVRPGSRSDPGVLFLQCPLCGGPLTGCAAVEVHCLRCQSPVRTLRGIIDFVSGSSSTELDKIDYDDVYTINETASLQYYRVLRASAGSLWPRSLGDALEIGCGTGGFSMAVLKTNTAGHVLLTDVSVKMLGLCRARLARTTDLQASSLTFSTYGGVEECFRPGVFDTCFGTAVVHHIIDVPQLLAQVHRLLKAGGRAFFMEPSLPFHAALTATLADLLADWLRRDVLPGGDVSRMLNWMAEVHCNIINTGDLEVLAEREDKHLFVGEAFVAMAEAAGFEAATALPVGVDLDGSGTIDSYLRQCGVSEPTLAVLREGWRGAQTRHFATLPPGDRSPSYLFWLEKAVGRAAPREATPKIAVKPSGPPQAGELPPTRLWLVLLIRSTDEDLELVVEGWCMAPMVVRSIRLTACGVSGKVPVWRPRRDVQALMNKADEYPPLHALCSGVSGVLRLPSSGAADAVIRVDVDIITGDSAPLPAGSVALVPDGDSRPIMAML